jgi:hypothetical protein
MKRAIVGPETPLVTSTIHPREITDGRDLRKAGDTKHHTELKTDDNGEVGK